MLSTTQFVAACCRWPHSDASRGAVAAAASAVEDWEAVKQAITVHRVAPLVHQAVHDLEAVPADVRGWVKQCAHSILPQAMGMARECLTLDKTLRDGGLAPLHIKGPVLGQLAYSSIVMKFSRDLDIFVPAHDVGTAITCLEAAGYQAEGDVAPFRPAQIDAFVRNFKDLTFIGPTGTIVELHWRLVHHHELAKGLATTPGRQSVNIGGMATLETLGPEDLVRYLILHGASHHWHRLKWLADLAAYLAQLPDETRTEVLERVGRGPSRDACASSLALCDMLLGTTYAPDLSPRAQALLDYAVARIDRPGAPPKTLEGDLRRVQDLIAMRHLFPSIWATMGDLKSHLVAKADVLAMPLPQHLNGLYVVIRLPSLLWRRLRALTRSRATAASQGNPK